MRRCLITALLITLSALLSSCGGGTTMAEGGIGGTGIAMGRVAQVGSVYVNGYQYNTDAASFIVNGDSGKTLNDIHVGMVVRVTGSKDPVTATGTAEVVEYRSLLAGPIESDIDPISLHRTIMGQQVHINPDTVFENSVPGSSTTLDTLSIADLVEVSGFSDGVSGEILATRIELVRSLSSYRIFGRVAPIDATSFSIGGLTIELSGQSLPIADSFVEVTSSIPPAGDILIAEQISVVSLDGTVATDGESVGIEGIIASGLDTATDLFVVNGQTVDASLTGYSGDTTSLAIGRIVEVEGIMNGSVLLAETIELEASSTERQEIAAVLEANSIDTAAGTLTLMGQVIHTNNSTIYENDIDEHAGFTLADLQAGDYLEAKVYYNSGVLTATKLELENLRSSSTYNAILEGTPSAIDTSHIEILNVTIDISGLTGYTFDGTQRIEVRGIYDPGTQTLDANAWSIAHD
ncbi:MAG: DUF5666 domain-containing protein [Candidatus Thiodiazotropha sp.]